VCTSKQERKHHAGRVLRNRRYRYVHTGFFHSSINLIHRGKKKRQSCTCNRLRRPIGL
jgi:hypothetical protein